MVALVVGCAGDGGSATDSRLAKPGNYVVVGPGAACELRAVPDDGSAAVVVPLLACKPAAAGQSVSLGFTAHSASCGVLTFSGTPLGAPAALLGQDAELLVCDRCGTAALAMDGCPLRGVKFSHAWSVVTLDDA
jgi:hypothetical protein